MKRNTSEMSAKVISNWRKKHCFLRLNGLRSSEHDPDVYRNGDPVRAIIVDTK